MIGIFKFTEEYAPFSTISRSMHLEAHIPKKVHTSPFLSRAVPSHITVFIVDGTLALPQE